jgi:hypothetical protein
VFAFYAHNGQGQVATQCFAQKFLDSKMPKEIATDLVDRYDGSTVVLRYKKVEGGSVV